MSPSQNGLGPVVRPAHNLTVDLGARSYDILIGSGLLAQIGQIIAPFAKGRKIAVITDENVYGRYGEALAEALSDYATYMVVRPAGESQKSMDGLSDVLESLFKAGLDRSDLIMAFGGGVIGDLAGFAASVYKRGCDFLQVPTTLLAQVDSSVGGKTAINSPFGKNLIGAFYQPKMVVTDTDVLATLPPRQIRAGYAEIVKYGLLGDIEFFDLLEAGLGERILNLEDAALSEAIETACRAKARIVAADEREQGQRALLNLGHTFAHIFELAAGYDGDLLHGEAVSAGMDMAFEFSARQGYGSPDDHARVCAHLKALGMPTAADMASYLSDTDALMAHMQQDKKTESGRLTLILVEAIGRAFVQKDVPQEAVRTYLQELRERYA